MWRFEGEKGTPIMCFLRIEKLFEFQALSTYCAMITVGSLLRKEMIRI
jgi:hypothetical protein